MILALGALAASTASACCVAGATRSWRVRVSAALMVAAMAGCAAAESIPALGLAAFALALASVPFALERRDGAVHPMSLHRALGGVVMAALVAVAGGMHGMGGAGASGMPGHAHPALAPGALHGFVLAAVAGYLVLGAWVAVRAVRARPAAGPQRVSLGVGEVVAMGAGMLLMGAM